MRILRIFRALRFVNEVGYVTSTAIQATAKLAAIVLIVVFVSGIIVTNLLWDSEDDGVAEEFADLHTSMWSLFELMTLDNWTPRAHVVLKVTPSMWIFYVLFVFVASTALMSLVPAIFIELNMTAREREKEKAVKAAKNEQHRKDRTMLSALFDKSDIGGNGRVSLDEMQLMLSDDRKVRELQDEGYCKRGDVRDVKLGLFDLLEMEREEAGNMEEELDKDEFIGRIMGTRDDVDNVILWRSGTVTRMQLCKLSSRVQQGTLMNEERHAEVLQLVDAQQEAAKAIKDDIAKLDNKFSLSFEQVQQRDMWLREALTKLDERCSALEATSAPPK